MTIRRLGVFAVIALAAIPFASAEKAELPVTRVALFSSGVGFFECDTTVAGNTSAELKFRTNQINDIIKSMVVQDLDGGRIGVIRYASQDPIEKTLRSFGVDLTGKPTLGELLDQLRGEPVETRGLRKLDGTIVNVEKTPIYSPEGKIIEKVEQLTLLNENGLCRVALREISSIRLTNDKVDAELRKALATLASAHNADKKSVEISFDGVGERRVKVAYLLEAPLWKTSYRLVLKDDDKPFIQGWATVENATEEDWNNVDLSLVSGRPISFVMDLYTPLYVPRPVEQLELYASLRPPDYAGTLEQLHALGYLSDDEGTVRRGGRRGNWADKAESKAAPQLGTALWAQPKAPAPPVMEAPAGGVFDLDLGIESVASAEEAGELFEYRIASPVSIPRQHSAMLPIVNGDVEATKLSIFNPATHPKHPLNGLELRNTTDLHLMQGPVTVFDGGVYAGDAKLPDLKPDEKRLVAYALDLSTEVSIKQRPKPEELIGLRIIKGVLYHRHRYHDRREYTIKNKLDRPRSVLLEQSYSSVWTLIEPKEPYERTANTLRFKVEVPAKKTVKHSVLLESTGEHTIALSNAGLDEIRYYLKTSVITPGLKKAMERVIELRTALDRTANARKSLERQRNEATEDQERIRQNLRTLDKKSDAYQRQLTRFDEVDNHIIQLADDIDAARIAEREARKALDAYLLSLNVDE